MDNQVIVWIDGWMDIWMLDGYVNGWMDVQMMDGDLNGQMDGDLDGWMDIQMEIQKDGQTGRQMGG